MELFPIVSVFWTGCIVLWVFLTVLTVFQTNRGILERKGYSAEYIVYVRRSAFRRNIWIAIVVPILGILAGLVVYAVVGDIESPRHAGVVLVLWLLLIVPFPIIDHRQSQRDARAIAMSTGATLVVDLNFRVLHLVFYPRLEFILTVAYLLYFALFFGPFHVAFIHVALLWVLYFTARFTRHLTPPAMRDAYIFLFVFLMVNQALLLFHVIREMVRWSECCAEDLADPRLVLGLILAGALAVKAFWYLLRLPEFTARLRETHPTGSTTR